MNNKTTVTALNVSVGADNGQSPSVTKHSNSITDNNCVRNLQSTGTPVGENLETVSMEELYDTVYPIKKPLVEDLIYNGVYEVFAVMSVNIHEFEYWKFVMARNKEEHDEFIDKVEEHSLWRQDNKLKYGEHMLMLSTCDNGKGDDCRIVVIGKNI